MASELSKIVNNIVALLKTIDGAPNFVNDLSDTPDRVLIGTPDLPAQTPPRVYVLATSVPSEHGRSLGAYRRNFSITLIGYTAAVSTGAGEKLLPAVELLNDIMNKLEADGTLPAPGGGLHSGPALSMKIDGDAFDGSEAGTETQGTVVAIVSGFYNVITGI